MEKNISSFKTSDGMSVEVFASFVANPRATIVVWPCMGGSVLMYRCPVERFTSGGCSVILFNPRGHGASGGQFVPELAARDLHEFLSRYKTDLSPLYIIGHSAGANAALQFATGYERGDRFLLVSPVLDSIESLRYMYRIKTIAEFNMLIGAITRDRDFTLSVLENEEWMEPETWRKKDYLKRLNDISGDFHVGSFLEILFIDGYNAFDDLILHGEKSTVLLPRQDNWYPFETVKALTDRGNVRLQILQEAGDHFFTGAWGAVWDWVLEDLTALF